jgi:hypothetical protein
MYTTHLEAIGAKGFSVLATHDNGILSTFRAMTIVNSFSEAQSIAAKFPKYLKVVAYKGGRVAFGYASFNSNKTTGDKNEASVKRVRKFLEICDKLGLITKFDDPHALNQISDRAEVERQLNA